MAEAAVAKKEEAKQEAPKSPLKRGAETYEVRAAYTGKALTDKQRRSSLFSEAPRVGTTILRRGRVLRLTDQEMKQMEHRLKMLLDAEAIVINLIGMPAKMIGKQEEPKKEEPKMAEPTDPATKADMSKTQEVKITPPPAAMKDGPESSGILPANPAAGADAEVDKVIAGITEQPDPSSSTKKRSKKG